MYTIYIKEDSVVSTYTFSVSIILLLEMKKGAYIFILSIFVFTTAVAMKIHITSNDKERARQEETMYTATKALPSEYTPDMAKAKGDVVIQNNNIYNKKRLDIFLENIKKKKIDKVQLVSYTDKGDALIEQLYFNGDGIVLITDNTRDEVTSKEHREINRYDVASIEVKSKEGGTLYVATLLNGESFDILYYKNIL